jgi:hypothetical protein
LAVDRGRNIEAGDVEDNLFSVSGEDPPLAEVTLYRKQEIKDEK